MAEELIGNIIGIINQILPAKPPTSSPTNSPTSNPSLSTVPSVRSSLSPSARPTQKPTFSSYPSGSPQHAPSVFPSLRTSEPSQAQEGKTYLFADSQTVMEPENDKNIKIIVSAAFGGFFVFITALFLFRKKRPRIEKNDGNLDDMFGGTKVESQDLEPISRLTSCFSTGASDFGIEDRKLNKTFSRSDGTDNENLELPLPIRNVSSVSIGDVKKVTITHSNIDSSPPSITHQYKTQAIEYSNNKVTQTKTDTQEKTETIKHSDSKNLVEDDHGLLEKDEENFESISPIDYQKTLGSSATLLNTTEDDKQNAVTASKKNPRETTEVAEVYHEGKQKMLQDPVSKFGYQLASPKIEEHATTAKAAPAHGRDEMFKRESIESDIAMDLQTIRSRAARILNKSNTDVRNVSTTPKNNFQGTITETEVNHKGYLERLQDPVNIYGNSSGLTQNLTDDDDEEDSEDDSDCEEDSEDEDDLESTAKMDSIRRHAEELLNRAMRATERKDTMPRAVASSRAIIDGKIPSPRNSSVNITDSDVEVRNLADTLYTSS